MTVRQLTARRLHGAPRWSRLATVIGIFAAAFSAAGPSADLAKCAGITDPTARLACYDALGGPKSNGNPTNAALPVTPGANVAPSAPAPASTPPAANATTPGAPGSPSAPTTSPFASDPRNFGFTEAQVTSTQQQATPKSIEAHIAKLTETRLGPTSALLDNGQTWVFVDSEQNAGLKPQDPVTIKRGALGSFLLITRSHQSYHVRRLQ